MFFLSFFISNIFVSYIIQFVSLFMYLWLIHIVALNIVQCLTLNKTMLYYVILCYVKSHDVVQFDILRDS